MSEYVDEDILCRQRIRDRRRIVTHSTYCLLQRTLSILDTIVQPKRSDILGITNDTPSLDDMERTNYYYNNLDPKDWESNQRRGRR